MSIDKKLLSLLEKSGVNVTDAVMNSYRALHETKGIGFGKGQNKSSFVSFWFILDDGSYYKDTIPMAIKGIQSNDIAYTYSHILLAYFELNYDTQYKMYGRSDEILYKH